MKNLLNLGVASLLVLSLSSCSHFGKKGCCHKKGESGKQCEMKKKKQCCASKECKGQCDVKKKK